MHDSFAAQESNKRNTLYLCVCFGFEIKYPVVATEGQHLPNNWTREAIKLREINLTLGVLRISLRDICTWYYVPEG